MKFLQAFLFTAAVLVSTHASTATFTTNVEPANFVQTLTADGFDTSNVIQANYHNCDHIGQGGTVQDCAREAGRRGYPKFNTYGRHCYGCY